MHTGSSTYKSDQDNLVAAIFSHHRVVLEKVFRQENPCEEDKNVYELKKFLDPDHQQKLAELINNTTLTRLENTLTQAEILEQIIAFITEEINLNKLLATTGQRNTTAIVELLNESSKEHLREYIKQRFDKRHFYTISAKTAKKNIGVDTTKALIVGSTFSLFTGTAVVLTPIAICTLIFAGIAQCRHNISTMFRCILIANELKLDLLQNDNEHPSASITLKAKKTNLAIENTRSISKADQVKHSFFPAWSIPIPFLFSPKNKNIMDDQIDEIEMDEFPIAKKG